MLIILMVKCLALSTNEDRANNVTLTPIIIKTFEEEGDCCDLITRLHIHKSACYFRRSELPLI